METHEFKSKIDPWVYGLLALGPIAILAVLFGLWEDFSDWIRLLLAMIAVLEFWLFRWMFNSLRYILAENELIIKIMFMTIKIPYKEITNIEESRHPLSAPAFSMDRVKIQYGRKSTLVSPEQKSQFMDLLERKVRNARF